jgi:UDP-N-acetylmuramoyl-L-alanyl-D-glutamate--2,6-diaminopimelate ligase
VELIPDRARAIEHALSAARAGDIVVIAGKGHETVQIIGDVLQPFSDRRVVEDWCAAQSAMSHKPAIEP